MNLISPINFIYSYPRSSSFPLLRERVVDASMPASVFFVFALWCLTGKEMFFTSWMSRKEEKEGLGVAEICWVQAMVKLESNTQTQLCLLCFLAFGSCSKVFLLFGLNKDVHKAILAFPLALILLLVKTAFSQTFKKTTTLIVITRMDCHFLRARNTKIRTCWGCQTFVQWYQTKTQLADRMLSGQNQKSSRAGNKKKQRALPMNPSSIKSKTKLQEPWEQTATKWGAHRFMNTNGRWGEVMGPESN